MIVTQREGVVAIFTTNGDAELRQRAVLDIDGMDLDPRGLADLGRTLAHQLAWSPLPTKPTPVKKPAAAALPKPTPTPVNKARRTFPDRHIGPGGYVVDKHGTRYLPRGHAGSRLRLVLADEMAAHLETHPGSTVTQIRTALNLGATTAASVVADLTRNGRIVRGKDQHGTEPARYSTTTTTTTENP